MMKGRTATVLPQNGPGRQLLMNLTALLTGLAHCRARDSSQCYSPAEPFLLLSPFGWAKTGTRVVGCLIPLESFKVDNGIP